MKIILSIADVKQLVAAKFGNSVGDFEVEVERPEDTIAPIIAALEKIKSAAYCNKIGAIKLLRSDHTDYGLWEAKIVVENIDTAIRLVKLNKAWPYPVRSDLDGQGFMWK